jgi:O-antigen/teichoic acid export membrane protein
MNPSQRLFLNTSASYTRSVIGVGLSLFSTRWVLSALGEVDYGLFNLIGSMLVFITLLNTVMSGSASRHFAFSIGQGDPLEVNRWFNAAFSIHLCLASASTLIGWFAGEYVISHYLSIPVERLSDCLNVFRISLISLFVGMLSVPFVAMFRAKQHIAELSVLESLHYFLTFILAWSLTLYQGKRLIFYAIGMTTIMVFVFGVQILRAVFIFQECTFVRQQWFDIKRLKKIFSFAGWNLIGVSGTLLRDNGSAILLNLFFGPKLNASFGIAKRVSAMTTQLASSMLGAFSPEITASEGRGDRSHMIKLSLRACKFGTILVMFFSIPLIVEMDYVLKLWLQTPPPYTGTFCKLILFTFLIDRLSSGYMLAVNAYGKIAFYQATLGTTLILTLPLAWFFLKLGYAPTTVGVAFVITMTGCSIGRVFWVRRLLKIPIHRWIITVVLPCSLVAIVSTFSAIAPAWFLTPSFLRLSLTTLASVFSSFMAVWLIALTDDEKEFFRQNIRLLIKKTKDIRIR